MVCVHRLKKSDDHEVALFHRLLLAAVQKWWHKQFVTAAAFLISFFVPFRQRPSFVLTTWGFCYIGSFVSLKLEESFIKIEKCKIVLGQAVRINYFAWRLEPIKVVSRKSNHWDKLSWLSRLAATSKLHKMDVGPTPYICANCKSILKATKACITPRKVF